MKETCRFFTSLAMASVLAVSACPATAETAEPSSTNGFLQAAIQNLLASSQSAAKSDAAASEEESKDFLGKLEEDGFLSADTIQKIRAFLDSCNAEPSAEDSAANAAQDNPVLHKISELTQSGKLDEEILSAIEAVINTTNPENQPMNGQLTGSRLNEMLESGTLNSDEVETIIFQMLRELLQTSLEDQSITQTMYDTVMGLMSVG